jgi:uncharacterized membrane protein
LLLLLLTMMLSMVVVMMMMMQGGYAPGRAKPDARVVVVALKEEEQQQQQQPGEMNFRREQQIKNGPLLLCAAPSFPSLFRASLSRELTKVHYSYSYIISQKTHQTESIHVEPEVRVLGPEERRIILEDADAQS